MFPQAASGHRHSLVVSGLSTLGFAWQEPSHVPEPCHDVAKEAPLEAKVPQWPLGEQIPMWKET